MFETDEQQSQALRDWCYQHWVYMVVFLVILFGGFFLVQVWKKHHENYQKSASLVFSRLINALQSEEHTSITKQYVSQLNKSHPHSPFTHLAQLETTHASIHHHQWQAAIRTLKKLSQQAKQPALKDIANLRLVRIYLYAAANKKIIRKKQALTLAHQALSSLSNLSQNKPLTLILAGDLAILEKKFKAAHNDYLKAQQKIPKNVKFQSLRMYVESKLIAAAHHSKSSKAAV